VYVHPNKLGRLVHDLPSSIAALSRRFFRNSSLIRVA
jgi:hypothetical protein